MEPMNAYYIFETRRFFKFVSKYDICRNMLGDYIENILVKLGIYPM